MGTASAIVDFSAKAVIAGRSPGSATSTRAWRDRLAASPRKTIRLMGRHKEQMKLSDLIETPLSVISLLRKARTLGESPAPGELVSFSQSCRVIQPIQVTSEFLELAGLVKALECQALLEIGTFRGGTLFVFSQLAAADATVISLDLHRTLRGRLGRFLQEPLFRGMVRPGQKFAMVRSDSHQPQTLARIEAQLQGRKLDFLFIDGDHSYEGVKKDFLMYSPLVRTGGLIAFHDVGINTPVHQVQTFWNEIKGDYVHKEFIDNSGSFRAGIGVLWI